MQQQQLCLVVEKQEEKKKKKKIKRIRKKCKTSHKLGSRAAAIPMIICKNPHLRYWPTGIHTQRPDMMTRTPDWVLWGSSSISNPRSGPQATPFLAPSMLFRISKGVRDIPGNVQTTTSSIPSGKALMYFGLFLATGIFFVFIAFAMFLPVIVLMPQKFAICFTLGCGFIVGSFFALKGPSSQLAHMTSPERLPFTLGFICSMAGSCTCILCFFILPRGGLLG